MTQTQTRTKTKTKTLLLTVVGFAAAAAVFSSVETGVKPTVEVVQSDSAASGGQVITQPSILKGWGTKPTGYKQRPAPDLTVWLRQTENQDIASAIKFWDPTLNQPVSFPQWSAEQKDELKKAFVESWRWYETGAQPESFPTPPENIFFRVCTSDFCRSGGIGSFTFLTYADARKIYVNAVADNLAAEMGAWFPWSLRKDMSSNQLADFFNPSKDRFKFIPYQSIKSYLKHFEIFSDKDLTQEASGIGLVTRWSVPDVRPRTILGFLKSEKLIGLTRRDNIGLLLGWAKRLEHANGWPDFVTDNANWQYPGLPPISRMLKGTVSRDSQVSAGSSGLKNYTYGCHGTHELFSAVLASVLVPVGARSVCGHSLSTFPTEGLALSHDDDPYSLNTKTMTFNPDELLVRQSYFDKYLNGQCSNVGRRVAELDVKYISGYLLDMYCQDLASHTGVQEGKVFISLAQYFSLSELEAAGLWTRLEKRKGECKALTTIQAQKQNNEPMVFPSINTMEPWQ